MNLERQILRELFSWMCRHSSLKKRDLLPADNNSKTPTKRTALLMFKIFVIVLLKKPSDRSKTLTGKPSRRVSCVAGRMKMIVG